MFSSSAILADARHGAFVLALFSALIFFPGLGRREVLDVNEGQRVHASQEMLRTGDWIVPHLNGKPYLKKPPLLYWEVAGLVSVFGLQEGAARLPSAILGVGMVLLVFAWGRRMAGGQRVALLAGAITAVNYVVFVKARECELDIALAFFTLAALAAWWDGFRHLRQGEARAADRSILLGGAFLALAHLYKFPVSYVFLLPAWIGTAVMLRQGRWLLRWSWWVAMVCSILPLAAWAGAAIHSLGAEAAVAVWKQELLLRAKATEINSGPVWYYIERLVACWIPWCAAYPALFTKKFRRIAGRNPLDFHFLWTGAAGSIVVLSLIPAKETEYMICAAPLVSMLLAWAIVLWAGDFDEGAEKQGEPDAPQIRPERLRPERLRWIWAGLALCAGVIWIALPFWELRQNSKKSVRAVAEATRQAMQHGRALAIHRSAARPHVFFYLASPHPVPVLYNQKEIRTHLADNPGSLLLLEQKVLDAYDASGALPALKPLTHSAPSARLVLAEAVKPAESANPNSAPDASAGSKGAPSPTSDFQIP